MWVKLLFQATNLLKEVFLTSTLYPRIKGSGTRFQPTRTLSNVTLSVLSPLSLETKTEEK